MLCVWFAFVFWFGLVWCLMCDLNFLQRLSKRKEASGSPFAEAEDESSAFEYSTPAQQSKRRNQQFRCNDLWTAKGSRSA